MMEAYDVLVAGAGAAGLCAAVAAAREGARTLLLEKSSMPGGSNTQSLVGPLMGFHAGKTQVVRGLAQEIVDRLSRKGGTLGHIPDPLGVASTITPIEPELLKQVDFELLREERNITLRLHTFVTDAERSEGRIHSVTAAHKGGTERYSASVYIDATGDGDLAARAGAAWHEGRAEDGLSQPMTLVMKIGGVDFSKVRKAMEERPDQFVLCPEADQIPYVAVSGYFEEVRKAREDGLLTFPRDRVLLFEGVRPGEAVVNMSRIIEKSALNAAGLTDAETEGQAQAAEILRFLRERIDGFQEVRLLATGAAGIRESRHIQGAYTLEAGDILRGASFPDAAAVCAFPIDIHDPRGKELTWVRTEAGQCYDVPYRVMLPRGVDNLLVTGRCVSATHEAAASVRITPTAMALGEAAGIAAAMCAESSRMKNPGEISATELQQRIAARGGIPGKAWAGL